MIIACDFASKSEVLDFLGKFTEEKPFVKIGMELFYAEGPPRRIALPYHPHGHRKYCAAGKTTCGICQQGFSFPKIDFHSQQGIDQADSVCTSVLTGFGNLYDLATAMNLPNFMISTAWEPFLSKEQPKTLVSGMKAELAAGFCLLIDAFEHRFRSAGIDIGIVCFGKSIGDKSFFSVRTVNGALTNVTLSGWTLDNPIIPASGTFGYGYEFAELYDINC